MTTHFVGPGQRYENFASLPPLEDGDTVEVVGAAVDEDNGVNEAFQNLARAARNTGLSLREFARAFELQIPVQRSDISRIQRISKETRYPKLEVTKEPKDGDTRPYNRFREVRKRAGNYKPRKRKSLPKQIREKIRDELSLKSTKGRKKNQFHT